MCNISRIGIVGGAGFIGSSLVKSLSSVFDVSVLDIKEPENRSNHVEFELCDIRNYSCLKKALTDVDLVLHLAVIQIPLINENRRLAYEVNFTGTVNICRAVDELPNIKGLILAGSWHTIGEKELNGVVDEEFGFRPDKVEDRARPYVLSKIAQEAVVRFYDEMSDKIYGVIRTGTVLGEGMPENTAANIFITRGLRSESITPYKHSMYRPMLYTDVHDVCKAYEKFVEKIMNDEFEGTRNSLSHIVNVFYSKPITILEMANIVRDTIVKCTNGEIKPQIEIVEHGQPLLFAEEDKDKIKVDVTRAKKLLGLERLTSPKESIERVVKNRLGEAEFQTKRGLYS
jgi:UDP-glucose 4-epimerase